MNTKETLEYVQIRQLYIAKNKTNDVFCAGCMKATIISEGASVCCRKEVITKEEALRRIPIIISRLKERL